MPIASPCSKSPNQSLPGQSRPYMEVVRDILLVVIIKKFVAKRREVEREGHQEKDHANNAPTRAGLLRIYRSCYRQRRSLRLARDSHFRHSAISGVPLQSRSVGGGESGLSRFKSLACVCPGGFRGLMWFR